MTGYAYETIPGKSIIAGATKQPEDGPSSEPTTLGVWALGVSGLAIWKREESVSAGI